MSSVLNEMKHKSPAFSTKKKRQDIIDSLCSMSNFVKIFSLYNKGSPVHVAPSCVGSGKGSTTLGLMYVALYNSLQILVCYYLMFL
jgi:hypothetical protein